MKISDLLNKYGSDKAKYHSYGDFYDELFESLSHKVGQQPIDLLEIGVLGGASCKAWKEYGCNVTGIDVVSEPDGLEGITYIKSDVKNVIIRNQYDIIIDDGSHQIRDILYVIKKFPRFLRQHGVLVIEDVPISIKRKIAARLLLPFGYKMRYVDLRDKKGHSDDFLIVITKN